MSGCRWQLDLYHRSPTLRTEDLAPSCLSQGPGWVLPVPGGLLSYLRLLEAGCSWRLGGCCRAMRLPRGWRRVNQAFKN